MNARRWSLVEHRSSPFRSCSWILFIGKQAAVTDGHTVDDSPRCCDNWTSVFTVVMEAASSPGCAPSTNRNRTHAQREFQRQRARDRRGISSLCDTRGFVKIRPGPATPLLSLPRSGLYQDGVCQTVGSPASNARQLHT